MLLTQRNKGRGERPGYASVYVNPLSADTGDAPTQSDRLGKWLPNSHIHFIQNHYYMDNSNNLNASHMLFQGKILQ